MTRKYVLFKMNYHIKKKKIEKRCHLNRSNLIVIKTVLQKMIFDSTEITNVGPVKTWSPHPDLRLSSGES